LTEQVTDFEAFLLISPVFSTIEDRRGAIVPEDTV